MIFGIIFGIGFSFGNSYGVSSVHCQVCKPEQVNFSLFWEAWNTLKENYVDPEKFNEQKAIYGAISGMVSSLGDPYTSFFSPEENKKFMEEVNGSFEGVGMEVGVKNKQLKVVSPLDGTPAQKAGLKAGDLIVKIDNKDTTNFTVDEAVSLIKGPHGTEVTLTIFREGWSATKDFKIIRERISVPTVKWELKDNDIAYIKLMQFSETADNDFRKAAAEILKSPAKSIIFDLRNNPGGLLGVAQSISGWFVKNGSTVVSEDFGQKGEQNVLKASGGAQLAKYPITILINEGSASAAEILAAAIKENRSDVQIIGQKSYGKGSVQQMERLSDESSLKITIAKWLTPNGNTINEVGIEPDIKIEITDDDFEKGKDPQLDKAIEIIKQK